MVMTQKTHLQPAASARNPPATGPMIGPTRGPMAQIDTAGPLSAALKMSPNVPAPIVMTVDPATPARSRNTMSMLRLLLTAQPIVKMMKKTFEV
jgi:hypothetical protein